MQQSLVSASVMEGKEDHIQTEPGQQDTTSSAVQAAVANGVINKGRTRPTLPILLAFIALCLSIFLVALDTVLIPTALPAISVSFHISDSLYVWIGSAYLLANAASVPFWGKLSDIFGRKPVILAANLIFLLGSILCAVSVDAAMLVAGRIVQGFGGGGVVVLVHVCVSDLFSIRYVVVGFLTWFDVCL
jgi:MFS family permease